MDTQKEAIVSTTTEAAKADPTQSQPTTAETKIHWADTSSTARPDLEQRFEAMRARNWMTERMVQQYQKHWNCGREAALERLLAKSGK
jgi:hypothetical protein